MAMTELTKTNQKTKIEDEKTSLKGTLASVLLLGLFLILSWLAVFFLFLDRV
ncbi:cytochrome c oxidase subunit 2A [Bacillus sp. HNG]|uniref:cytochrome c oxidase subunit 2A n=1 Tax=Bacillus sp. HNG TaxID=2293325 RepID=UPI000E2F8B22|nr:cytochrome c oxidase subunit 2A [Bacillus sp. HNG]RFB16906.1 cytochrome c oxidase subunit 2A [Bacillus sp. HNG]